MAEEMIRVGTVVAGRYPIEAVLGAGAMGTVYKAHDTETGERIALKILRPHLAGNDEAQARFGLEALVGLRIDHPNCVSVADFGTGEDGSIFLAMELLDGESLGDVIERVGRMEWQRALRIVRHVLRGLAHAHAQDIVHRDIKPDNVFLCPRDGDADFARVLDFGIAKLMSNAGPAITQAGITVGTPEYLSPEQAAGGILDGRSDLYSVSALLFTMIAGHAPFVNEQPMKILLAHATAPVPHFDADLDVPPEVEDLVRTGLAKLPAQRIATASDYIARIDALLGETIAVPDLPPPRPHATIRAARPAAPVRTGPPAGARLRAVIARATDRVRRLPRNAKIIGGVSAGILTIGIIAAIAGSGGGNAAPAAAAPKPAPVDVAQKKASLPPRDPAIDKALELAGSGKGKQALAKLRVLRDQNPTDAWVPYAQARVYQRTSAPKQAVAAYHAAIALEPAFREDRTLIADLIGLLATKTAWQAAQDALVDDVGAAALPAVTDAAEHHKNAKVRARAADVRDRLESK